MVAFLQIVCFAGICMKLGDLMSMFSLNANDSQSMGRRIFRRPYLYLAHRARRMEHRIARAVSAGGISDGVAGAVAGSAVAGKRAERKNTASKENRGNTTVSYTHLDVYKRQPYIREYFFIKGKLLFCSW